MHITRIQLQPFEWDGKKRNDNSCLSTLLKHNGLKIHKQRGQTNKNNVLRKVRENSHMERNEMKAEIRIMHRKKSIEWILSANSIWTNRSATNPSTHIRYSLFVSFYFYCASLLCVGKTVCEQLHCIASRFTSLRCWNLLSLKLKLK